MDMTFDKKEFALLLEKAMGDRSINQYALHSKVSPTYISRLLRGLVEKSPGALIIRKLADKAYNGISYEELMKAAGHIEEKLPDNAIDVGNLVRIPIYGVIRAGEPIYATENIEGYDYVPEHEAKHGDYFYLRVTGDSMIGSRIHPGDLVYVRKQSDVDNGDIAVVLNGEDATLKRVFKTDGKIILQPDNPKYQPKVFTRGDIKILGKVLHVKFKP